MADWYWWVRVVRSEWKEDQVRILGCMGQCTDWILFLNSRPKKKLLPTGHVYLPVLQAHVHDQTSHGLSQTFCSPGISFLQELMVPLITQFLNQKILV